MYNHRSTHPGGGGSLTAQILPSASTVSGQLRNRPREDFTPAKIVRTDCIQVFAGKKRFCHSQGFSFRVRMPMPALAAGYKHKDRAIRSFATRVFVFFGIYSRKVNMLMPALAAGYRRKDPRPPVFILQLLYTKSYCL